MTLAGGAGNLFGAQFHRFTVDEIREFTRVKWNELGVDRGDHRMRVSQLLLYEQQISPGPFVSEISIGVPQ